MEITKSDTKNYAKVHSVESFGTLDGPRNLFCFVFTRLRLKM